MPFLIALMGIVLAAGMWAWRIRMAREALDEVAGITGDIISAARRLGFRRQANVHPVESVDEPALAIAALGMAYMDLASLPTTEQLDALRASVRARLGADATKTDELLIVGRWLVSECKTPDAAITRLGKRLAKLDPAGFQALLPVLQDVEASSNATPSPRQRDALDEIARIFRLK